MWPFSKTKAVPKPSSIFDESKLPKVKGIKRNEADVELEAIMSSVKERVLPKRVRAESFKHKESKYAEQLVRFINKLRGIKDYAKEYEDSEARLLLAIQVCKDRKAFTRDEWEENRIEIDKVLKKYMEASVRYAEFLYDDQTAKPLNRATNKFVKD